MDLRSLRTRSGLSQDQLSRRSGVSQTSISRYERGETIPLPAVAARLMAALDAPPADPS